MKNIVAKLPLALIAIGIIAVLFNATTEAYSTDTEQSTDNTLRLGTIVIVTLLNDGFEGEPWDANWDGNGTTLWTPKGSKVHGGLWAAWTTRDKSGPFTTDDLDASTASSITVSFWFRPTVLEAGDILVQLYNGSAYNTWYDIGSYPSYVDNTWCYFSETTTDSQYFKANFRLRFNSSIDMPNEEFYLDDVLITIQEWQ